VSGNWQAGCPGMLEGCQIDRGRGRGRGGQDGLIQVIVALHDDVAEVPLLASFMNSTEEVVLRFVVGVPALLGLLAYISKVSCLLLLPQVVAVLGDSHVCDTVLPLCAMHVEG
jgi:hypothetical protein